MAVFQMTKEQSWRKHLRVDTIPVLLASRDEAVTYFTRHDLLNEVVEPIVYVWELPVVLKITRKQQADGSWKYPGRKTAVYPEYHYSLLETFKQFRILVQRYELNRKHTTTLKAAEYLFSCQTTDGDIRGMIGNQYATYYTGIILALLIKAGYEDDPRIEKGIRWLLSMRQDDGGWTIPIATHELNTETINRLTAMGFDRRPSS